MSEILRNSDGSICQQLNLEDYLRAINVGKKNPVPITIHVNGCKDEEIAGLKRKIYDSAPVDVKDKKDRKDFGEKIGGARKDLYSTGVKLSDLDDMNDSEKNKYISKKYVWPAVDCMKLMADGTPPYVAYCIREIRRSCPANISRYLDRKEAETSFVEIMSWLKKRCDNAKAESDICDIYKDVVDALSTCSLEGKKYSEYAILHILADARASTAKCNKKYNRIHDMIKMRNEGFGLAPEDKILKRYSFMTVDENTKVSECGGRYVTLRFIDGNPVIYYAYEPYNDASLFEIGKVVAIKDHNVVGSFKSESIAKEHYRNMEKKKSKKGFIPPQLSSCLRTGGKNSKDITGNDFLSVYHVRGGEFGVWMNDADAQTSMNMAFDALGDFALVLGIKNETAAFDSRLSIAFGARGKGNALAHYEPLREVINLTKMKGAGSLGHELFHAVDDICGKKLGVSGFMTEHRGNIKVPQELRDMVKILKGGEFYRNSIKMDRIMKKDSNGYWASEAELFARAGACYLEDKLKEKGITDPYLCGHADSAVTNEINDEGDSVAIRAFPVGEERERINTAFDNLIEALKNNNVL